MDLAFLSACQKSTGDGRLSEEAVHLAAGMLAAGYRGVIATMWLIRDRYASEFAKVFRQISLMVRTVSVENMLPMQSIMLLRTFNGNLLSKSQTLNCLYLFGFPMFILVYRIGCQSGGNIVSSEKDYSAPMNHFWFIMGPTWLNNV